jgi:predicted cupin superfamily sugar epimerase
MMKRTVEKIIEILGLEPLPLEGGLFRQTYVSSEGIMLDHLPDRYTTDKPFGTAIYYLLTSEPDSFSALHMLPTDEIWHFYLGDPVELIELRPEGSCEQVILGQDILKGQVVQHTVSSGIWQGSSLVPGGNFALMGTTMAPGFTPEDYLAGEREELIQNYPEHENTIRRLTRSG